MTTFVIVWGASLVVAGVSVAASNLGDRPEAPWWNVKIWAIATQLIAIGGTAIHYAIAGL